MSEIQYAYVVGGCLLTGLITWLITGAVRRILARRSIFDLPNPRSSHSGATPRGAGLAVVPTVLLAWLAIALTTAAPTGLLLVAVAAVGLAAVSFTDDVRFLPPVVRLTAQAVAVAVGLWTLDTQAVFQGLLPGWIALTVAGLLWLWFVNLFNFMDGIDGIAGVETAATGAGLAAVALAADLAPPFALLPATLAAVAIGFLPWNWHPARIFLGDVGSIPLGYLLGWLLLLSAAEGAWAAALILPAYFLADATVTIARRALRGERVWRAHREHFYQLAAAAALRHDAISLRVALADAILIALALLAVHGSPWFGLLGAAAVVAGLLASFALAARRPDRA